MPELPEVEVVKLGLEAQIVGKTFADLEVRQPKILVNSEAEVRGLLKDQTVTKISRRAKYILVYFERHLLLIHLRMTGQVIVRQAKDQGPLEPLPFTFERKALDQIDKHVHCLLQFTDGTLFLYRDVRRFGRLELVALEALPTHKGLSKLGVEPLEPEFTLTHFKSLLHSKRQIKPFLLDQTKVVGLGNIYVDEALFRAGIRPRRETCGLTSREIKKLHEAIPFVLNKAIAYGGTSLQDYLHVDGSKGTHQEELLVYGRTHQPCLTCGTELTRDVIAQRSTHYCQCCQK